LKALGIGTTMPGTLVLIVVISVWLLIAAIVIGYPLVTGRIRVGGPGSEPTTREGDPAGFWTAYAISTGMFLGISILAGFFLRAVLP
jgi:hypothetical protein